MPASTTQILFLTLITLITLITTAVVYLLSIKKEKMWFYSYVMMLIIQVQWMSDTGASLLYQNYYLHLASVIIFPSVVFSLFLIYVIQGNRNARQLLYILLAGEFSYMVSIIFLSILGNTPSYIQVNWAWFSNHLFSSLALVIDYFVILATWPFVHNIKVKIPLFIKVLSIFLLILITDSLVFTLGTFWGNPSLTEIINTNMITRVILASVLSPFISLYMSSITKNAGVVLEYRGWDAFTTKTNEQSIIIQETQAKVDRLQILENDLTQKNTDLEDQRKAILNVLDDVQKEKDIVSLQADELRRFKAATEQSNEMIVFTDAEGIVEWANSATETITGFTVAESAGKKAGVLWGNLMPKPWYTNLWKTIKIDKKTFVAEVQNHRKNGEKFWSTLTIYPLLDAQGNLQFIVATQRDITHEKEVDRMKTDFISLASHQLRTPLSAMKWFLEMLMAGDLGKLTKDQVEAISNVEQSNERMIALVNGLLNISRIESGRIIIDPTPTDIVELAQDVKQELNQKFDSKKQVLIVSSNKEIPSVMLDAKLIRQVLLNLLTNANKYTPEKGEITVFISRKNEELIVQVSDNGYGVPLQEQEKIFSRFFRASNVVKQETDGTGLGLYLAKAIIESSGGKIWFKSVEGEGTSFWFTLPMTGMKAREGEVRLS